MTDVVRGAAWSAVAPPAVSVVVPTCGRARYLPGLVEALERQVGAPPFEVVVADDASGDDTWEVLTQLAQRTPLPLAAVRLPRNSGAGAARNSGVALARGTVLAFTDDDCLPTPDWVAEVVAPFSDPDVVVVQGRTAPEPGSPQSTWDRSLWVDGPTPWLETCNLAYRRTAFDAVGGFDEQDPAFGRRGPGFGEDTWLGHRVLARGGRRVFAPSAVVHHRWRTASFADHVRERRMMLDFPLLVRRVPAAADACWGGVFLSRRTARFDAALLSVVTAAVGRRPAALLGVVPWLLSEVPTARSRRGSLALRLAQGAVLDLAGLTALAAGSLRHRRLVL